MLLAKEPTYQQLLVSYYGILLDESLLSELLALIDENAQSQAIQTIAAVLDYQVLNAALALLPEQKDQLEYLEIIREEYSSAHPLQWLTLKNSSSEVLLAETVERTLLSLISLLKK